MSYVCGHCGHTPDHHPLQRGDWELHPTYVYYKGKDTGAAGMQCGALYRLAKAGSKAWISAQDLAANLSDADSAANCLAVKLCQLRAKMGQIFPLESKTGPGGGYRWAA